MRENEGKQYTHLACVSSSTERAFERPISKLLLSNRTSCPSFLIACITSSMPHICTSNLSYTGKGKREEGATNERRRREEGGDAAMRVY